MPCVPLLCSFRPLWLSAAVVSMVGCQALVGDLPEPVALSSDGGSTADGGRTASGGSGGNGGGVPTDGGGGGSPQSGGGSSAGGAGGSGGERDGAASGGAVVDPTDGGEGGDASVDGGGGVDGGGVDSGGAPGSGGTATGGSGGSATGGSGGTGGGTGGATGGAGGATGGAGGKGTGGTGTCTTDFDNDGYIAKACGGNDCDDTDFDAKPGQTAFPQDARNSGGYDYNCDNVITKDPTLNRTVNCGVVFSACPTTAQGYFGANAADVPQCGAAASWGTCVKSGGLLCEKVPVASVKMGCR
jgi:hypothetical protein